MYEEISVYKNLKLHYNIECQSISEGRYVLMKCQFCNCPDSRVVDSRPTEEGTSIRRRRECANCGRRFTTYEKVELPQLLVIKKDNTRELFDAQKIRNGIIHACHKRPVTAADIERIVGAVEQMAYNSLQEEITTK